MRQFLGFIFRDSSLKITAIIIALVFWALALLDRSYDVTLAVPVSLADPGGKGLISQLDTRTASVVLQGKGRDLIAVRRNQLRFNLTIPEGKTGKRQLKLPVTELTLPANVLVRAVDPEYVELKQVEAEARIVPVEVPVKGQPASGLAVTVNRPPASVRLLGLEEELKLVSTVYTESLDMATVQEAGRRRLRALPPAGGSFSVEPDSVDIVIALEREGARIFLGVPVKVLVPDSRSADVDPTEAQIAVAGPASHINELKAEDIVAQIKVSGLQPGDYRLAAEISLPSGFHMVKCEPQLFDVTIR